MVLEKTLESPLAARRSNQSILKEISPECSLIGLMLKKILESALDSKEMKPVNPKGNKARIFTGRAGSEAESPIQWPHDGKS